MKGRRAGIPRMTRARCERSFLPGRSLRARETTVVVGVDLFGGEEPIAGRVNPAEAFGGVGRSLDRTGRPSGGPFGLVDTPGVIGIGPRQPRALACLEGRASFAP